MSVEFWRSRLTKPAYRVGEAAMYARISPQTVSAWERATGSPAVSAREARKGLSYLQLVEIAVVASMRKSGVNLGEIKAARKYLQKLWTEEYPFARAKFKTDGTDVLVDFVDADKKIVSDRLITANRDGQLIWTEMLSDRLREFQYDETGLVRSWFVSGRNSSVSIDPALAFGAPNVDGIPTRVIRDKWIARNDLEVIADDYGISIGLVREALEFEGISKEAQAKPWLN
jgi:uncharacterized protein (DUF433 family)/DNA-binding transcriptional MerR regulator